MKKKITRTCLLQIASHCETTKDSLTCFQEHNLHQSNKILLQHEISIILMVSKMMGVDQGHLITLPHPTMLTRSSHSWSFI